MTRTALPSKLIAIALAVVSLAVVALSVSAMGSVDEADAASKARTHIKAGVQNDFLFGTLTSADPTCFDQRNVFLVKQKRARRNLKRDRIVDSFRSVPGPNDGQVFFGSETGFDNSKIGRRYYMYAKATRSCKKAFSRTIKVDGSDQF